MQYLEEALGDQPYLLGEFGLTDIAMIPRFLRMESYGAMPAPALPRLNAWVARMKQRPSVQAIV
jgi:glutathione S-transferase